MWVNSWLYRNPIKALLLKLWSCSSHTMCNHCIVWVRSLVGFNLARSLRISSVSWCFWGWPCVSSVPCSPFSACFTWRCLLAFSNPPHPYQCLLFLHALKINSSYRHASAICTLCCSNSPVFSFQIQCWPEEPEITKSWCLPGKCLFAQL